MRIRGMAQAAALLCVTLLCVRAAAAQEPQKEAAQKPANPGVVIRTETRQVLVDVVVTDKKHNYIRDLSQKDFKVWEDDKEQPVKSFSYEADAASPAGSQKHYLVLFFDNSTMDFGDQRRARDAAAKFIDANVTGNRMMAGVNFTGALKIAQNFTSDAERLKQVVSGTRIAVVNPNAQAAGGPRLGSEAEFGQRTLLLALRTLARNMADVPGRKILVLFSAGFPPTFENRSELRSAVDMCNRSNVSVYPIDVRGLTLPPGFDPGGPGPRGSIAPARSRSIFSAFGGLGLGGIQASSFAPQQRGAGAGANPGGAGGGGGRAGSGSAPVPSNPGAGSRPAPSGGSSNPGYNPGTRNPPNNPVYNPTYRNPNPMNVPTVYQTPRDIIPKFPPTASTNQQVLFMLAEGTGGFVISNTNDMLGGLEKIGKEQNEYYLLGYTPPPSEEGTCHNLRVKVGRGGATVRARSGYCNVKQVDVLSGKPIERDLELRASADTPGTIQARLLTPFFYTSANAARVNIALEIPSSTIKFEKVKGKQHSTISILGIAYNQSGAVAARFSDEVNLDFAEKKDVDTFNEKPFYHYDNQFDIAHGAYKLKVVFSSGGTEFGKLEAPLIVDPYDGQKLFLSSVALSTQIRKVSELQTDLDAVLLEGRAPLVVNGLQITPAGTNRFKKTDTAICYLEVYEPLLTAASAVPTDQVPVEATPAPPAVQVGIQYRLLDRKTDEVKVDSGMNEITAMAKSGSPVIPLAFKIPVATLAPGGYRAEFKSVDSTGRMVTRFILFDLD